MDSRLERLQRALAGTIAGMPEEEWNWHPAGKWCAAEVLEHLFWTYTGTLKGFERVVQKGSPLVTPATWRQRWRSLVVAGFGYMPEGRKAPANTQPRGLSQEKVLAEFGARIAEMDEIISRCEARFGHREKLLDHPILGPLTGLQWRQFHLAHGLHHAKQIQRLRRGWAEERGGNVDPREKLLTAKIAKKSREGRKEEQAPLRSLRLFFAIFAVKTFCYSQKRWLGMRIRLHH